MYICIYSHANIHQHHKRHSLSHLRYVAIFVNIVTCINRRRELETAKHRAAPTVSGALVQNSLMASCNCLAKM